MNWEMPGYDLCIIMEEDIIVVKYMFSHYYVYASLSNVAQTGLCVCKSKYLNHPSQGNSTMYVCVCVRVCVCVCDKVI